MRTLRVNLPEREYDIKIESGCLKNAGTLIGEIKPACKVAIVTDSNVAPLYLETVENSLKESGYTTSAVTVPAGEQSKSMDMLSMLYGKMLDFGLTRTDLIVALGGGVVGDLTGLCAATLLRGVPFVQIPTTLLAQVDSSVGGKVAVNLPQGKNLVGAFYQPKMVIIDPDCLDTLSDRIFSDGMAEVIKYGAILDEDLFELLKSAGGRIELKPHIEEVIYRCCDLKRIVVEDDENDVGGRMILNFGHTFGHAIEKQYNFSTYTHGEAVAAGMCMAADMGERKGITPGGTKDRIVSVLKSYDLPTQVELDSEALRGAVKVDKKGDGNSISVILLERMGKAAICKVAKSEF